MAVKKAAGVAKKVAKAVASTLSQSGKDALTAFPVLRTGGKGVQRCVIGSNEIERLVDELGDLKGKTVVEMAAGPGLLTRALLEAGADKVIALEDKPVFGATLTEIQNKNPKRMLFMPTPPSSVFRNDRAHLAAFKILLENLQHLQNPPPGEPGNWVFTGVAPPASTKTFLPALATSSFFQNTSLFQYGTPRCALYVDKDGVKKFTAPPNERTASSAGIIADVLWDKRTNLDVIDGKGSPWSVAVDGLAPPLKEEYVLLCLTPKHVGLSGSERECLRYVSKLLMKMRSKKLSVAFEALGPGGSVLIQRVGLDPHSTGYTLTFQDFVKIAREFDRWEYKPANLESMDDMFSSWSESNNG
eukprot:comp23549_c1_seq1/m.39749 comp23549_c1_seq1/g.39749  ORF comp23549_c1_seq1/g.39749 comp23549_c1_seq1/m.39749 type:complete len:358 (-) comp23549_c1_seq1:694-1767(-)